MIVPTRANGDETRKHGRLPHVRAQADTIGPLPAVTRSRYPEMSVTSPILTSKSAAIAAKLADRSGAIVEGMRIAPRLMTKVTPSFLDSGQFREVRGLRSQNDVCILAGAVFQGTRHVFWIRDLFVQNDRSWHACEMFIFQNLREAHGYDYESRLKVFFFFSS